MFRLKKSDRQLVHRVLGGERDEYEVLVKRHYPAALSIALTYTGNSSDAEDVVQDAFVKAYTSLDQLKEPEKFLGWLSAIVRNAARKLYSKKKREQEILQQHQPESTESGPDVSMREMMQIMQHRLEGLDDTHREVLTMYYFGGQNSTEIAQALDVNKEAVLKRLQRAREALGHEMMAAIKEPEEKDKNHSKQIARIARAVIATGIAWEVAGLKTSIAAAAILTTLKAIFVVGGFATAGVGVYSITTNYRPITQPVDSTPPRESNIEYRSVPMITAVDEEARNEMWLGATVKKDVFTQSEIAETIDLPEPSIEDIWDDLDGSRWSAKVLGSQPKGAEEEIESISFQLDIGYSEKPEIVAGKLVDAGRRMTLADQNRAGIPFILFGKADYPSVALGLYVEIDSDEGTPEGHVMDLSGNFLEDRRKIVLSGRKGEHEFLKLEFTRKEVLSMVELNETIWRLKEFRVDGKKEGSSEFKKTQFEMTLRKGEIRIRDLGGWPVEMNFEGTRNNKEVDFMVTIRFPDEREITSNVVGTFNSKLHLLELSGDYVDPKKNGKTHRSHNNSHCVRRTNQP